MKNTSRHILEEVERGPLVWMLRTAFLVFWAILLMGVSVSVQSELEDEDGIVCSLTFPQTPGHEGSSIRLCPQVDRSN